MYLGPRSHAMIQEKYFHTDGRRSEKYLGLQGEGGCRGHLEQGLSKQLGPTNFDLMLNTHN